MSSLTRRADCCGRHIPADATECPLCVEPAASAVEYGSSHPAYELDWREIDPAYALPVRDWQHGQFYVMDRFASSAQAAYVSGPFDTRAAADADRREYNIADDCDVFEVPAR